MLPALMLGKDEGVGIAGDLGAGSLQLADLGSNGSVKLQLTVDLQFGVSLLNAGGSVAHLVDGLALAGTLGGVGQQCNTGVDAENLCGVSGLDGGLDDFVLEGSMLMAQSPMAMLSSPRVR